MWILEKETSALDMWKMDRFFLYQLSIIYFLLILYSAFYHYIIFRSTQ